MLWADHDEQWKLFICSLLRGWSHWTTTDYLLGQYFCDRLYRRNVQNFASVSNFWACLVLNQTLTGIPYWYPDVTLTPTRVWVHHAPFITFESPQVSLNKWRQSIGYPYSECVLQMFPGIRKGIKQQQLFRTFWTWDEQVSLLHLQKKISMTWLAS